MLKCFAIKDNKTGSFLNPFFTNHQVEAIRSIIQVLKDSKSLLAQFPDDYTLYNLVDIDPTNGSLVVYETPQKIADLGTLIAMEAQRG